MPAYKIIKARRSQKGGSLKSMLKKIHRFAKKHKLLSKGLGFAGKTFNNPALRTAGSVARKVGYGKKKRMYKRTRGAGIRTAGGPRRGYGLRTAGRGRKKKVGRPRKRR